MKRAAKAQLPLWSVAPTGRSPFRNALPKLKVAHGGSLALGRRKEKRPLSFKRPIHLVLRSEKAVGPWSLLRRERQVDQLLRKQARRHHVKIQHYVNVGNHLHIKLRTYSREGFGAFLKSFTALVARKITGSKKGQALKLRDSGESKFWDGLAFSRILYGRIEEKFLARYFSANCLEAAYGKEVRDIFLGKDALSPHFGYG